jgi:hypothetical protein
MTRLLADIGDKVGLQGVHRAYIDAAAYQQENLGALAAFFASLWIVVLTRTALQTRSTDRQQGTAFSSS